MKFLNFHRFIIEATNQSLKRIAVYNPFTIHKKGAKTKAVFALALVCLFWGTTWIASKEGVRHMPALELAGIRQLIAGALYVVFFLSRGARLPKGREWLPILVLSILNFLLSNGLSTWGVQYISAGLGSIMGAIFPLWLVLIGLFSSKEKLPRNAIIGLIVGFAGVCVIFYEHLHDFLIADFRFGIFLSLIATWTWAFGTLYTKKEAAKFNPYFSLGLQMVISGASLIILTYAIDTPTNNYFIAFADINWQAWASIAYLLIFGSIIAFIAYLYALQNLPTEQTSIYAYINPVVAILLGWLVFAEQLTIFIALGGIITLLGVFIVNKAFRAALAAPEQPVTEGM
jgi:drug/metabolite transporter (DMT)-like permease